MIKIMVNINNDGDPAIVDSLEEAVSFAKETSAQKRNPVPIEVWTDRMFLNLATVTGGEVLWSEDAIREVKAAGI